MKTILGITLIIGIAIGYGYARYSIEPTAGTCVDSMSNSIKSGFNNMVDKFSN